MAVMTVTSRLGQVPEKYLNLHISDVITGFLRDSDFGGNGANGIESSIRRREISREFVLGKFFKAPLMLQPPISYSRNK